jgi:hypothetical protein
MRENWKHLRGGIYIVRTQAGLRKAIRHHANDPQMEVFGRPTSYPCLVALSVGYSGREWVRVDAIPFNLLTQAITESDAA